MAQPPAEDFGERLRRLREARGIKRPDLAQRAGMPYSTLSEIENAGKETTRVSYLVALSAALSVSLRELLTGVAAKDEAPPPPVLTPREAALLRAFQSASPQEKTRIETFVAGMALNAKIHHRRKGRPFTSAPVAEERPRVKTR